MDSVTQFVLGAAAGGAFLGKKAGNRAVIWGGLVATIPDLDVFFYPLMDEAAKLAWHRGISHSILFNLLLTPLAGYFLYRINNKKGSFRDWTVFSFICLFTAVLLDCFNVYGTHVFKPFSNYQAAFNNISVIDPLYTIPLLISVLICFFVKSSNAFKSRLLAWGLVLSTLYMGATFAVKAHVNALAVKSFEKQGITPKRFMSAPSMFNAVLWRITAQTDRGFMAGYYSLFDKTGDIEFKFIPQNKNLLLIPEMNFQNSRELDTLIWFSRGWYSLKIDREKNLLFFSDLRFGEIYSDSPSKGTYVFKWSLEKRDSRVILKRVRPENFDISRALGFIWQRLKGKG
jgi:inner membrane protein